MSTKILLVEDDVNLGFVIKDNLQMRGYQVTLFEEGGAAWNSFQSEQYDLCLLDIMLPNMDGLTLATNIRRIDKSVPVIFLTAKSRQEDKLAGFEIGADDYITKPFSLEELFYRIEVFLKRTQVSKEQDSNCEIGSYQFIPSDYKLIYKQEVLKLTRRETEILSFLHARKGQIVSRQEILLTIWGEDDYFKGRSLDVFISKLRKYLYHDETVDIENIHGVGFKLVGG